MTPVMLTMTSVMLNNDRFNANYDICNVPSTGLSTDSTSLNYVHF